MEKDALIEAVAKEAGLSLADAAKAVEAFSSAVKDMIKEEFEND